MLRMAARSHLRKKQLGDRTRLPALLPALENLDPHTEGHVVCSLHGKWRHPDRMARKGNGDWVCTGEDKCLSDTPGRRTFPAGLAGNALESALRLRPRAAHLPPLGVRRIRKKTKSTLQEPSLGARVRGTRKGHGKGDVDLSWQRDGDLPEGMARCVLHNRLRYQDRLQRRGDGWICTDADRCRNVDEVRCKVHGRWRTMQNMRQDDDGAWACLPDCECR